VSGVTGFAVAGGRSRRMGCDKALLRVGGVALLDHALARLREVSDDVRILCGPEARYADRGAPLVRDVSGAGAPLVGVLSGLLALERPLGLFLAVDLPHVPAGLLRALVAAAAGFDAVVPLSPGGPEPLCAVYAKACVGPMRRALEREELRMTSFWSEVRVRQLPAAELAAFGDPGALFANVNTAEEYEATERGR
jgi:molybdopterin-guanine dinucleotide biosynthesis protein A